MIFNKTAKNAAGNKPEVSSICISPPNPATDDGTFCKPKPIDNEIAKIIMFLLFQSTPLNILIPADATIPNITITPPPNTAIGIEATKAPILGTRPQSIKKMAAIVTTLLLITPVIEINPTF